MMKKSFLIFLNTCILGTIANATAFASIAWVIVHHYQNLQSLAGLMLCFWLAKMLFEWWWGMIVDQGNQKYLLIIAALIRGMVLCSAAILIYKYQNLNVIYYVIMGILGVFTGLYNTVSIPLLRSLVSQNSLTKSNLYLDMSYELGNLLGLIIGSLIIGYLKIFIALFFSGMLFVISAFIMLWINYQKSNNSLSSNKLWNNFLFGMQYIKQRKKIITLYICQACITVQFKTLPLLLVFISYLNSWDATEYGWLAAILSLGVLTSNIMNMFLVKRYNLKIIISLECCCCFLGLLFFSYNLSYSCDVINYFFIGLGLGAWPCLLALSQQHTDYLFQGRVQAAFSVITNIIIIFIFLLVAFFGIKISPQHIYLGQSVLSLLVITILITSIKYNLVRHTKEFKESVNEKV